jgi:phage gpG-like protein
VSFTVTVDTSKCRILGLNTQTLNEYVGNEVVTAFKQNIDAANTLLLISDKPWEEWKNPEDVMIMDSYYHTRKGSFKRHTPLLYSGELRRKIMLYDVSTTNVTIICDVPYAQIQNDGGTIRQQITEKQRGFFWKMFYETNNEKWKRLALKRDTLVITIPARPFLGGSDKLNEIIHKSVVRYIHDMSVGLI